MVRKWQGPVSTCYVPWDADADWPFVLYSVHEGLKRGRRDHEYFTEFFDNSIAAMVYHSNKLEQTLHHDVLEGDTYVMIQKFMSGERKPPESRDWDAEGGRDQMCASSERQLYQYLAAARFLCEEHINDDLTVDIICECHRIMMEGSTSYGVPTKSTLRTELANAGFYVFIAPEHIRRGLQMMLSAYKTERDRGMHPTELATQLFYDFITIHPFVNGNGRLCRLLISYSLMRDGFLFYLSFSTGHKGRRQHYLHAINTARIPVIGSRKELNCILLLSCQRGLGNYFENLRVAGFNK
ncbi:fido domain-containing protein [Tribonema minus]|uniref:Fido domain-containing protein n=1 Tax=Tribonema minus TaxID=303371 RepID=A0A836CBJ6_9STRA|nr:fido domain-containing protein [Tribonema minus]